MLWRDVTGTTSLLQELLDHAEGYSEPVGNLGPRALVAVVRCQDSFAQIQGERSHAQTLPQSLGSGYTIC